MDSLKILEELEKLNEFVSLQNQVNEIRLKEKLGKQDFHGDMNRVFESVTKSNKGVSEEVTKTLTENSIRNNQALENLIDKFLEIMNDRGIIASYLLSPLSKITNPENGTQFKLVNDSSSNRVIDLLIHNTNQITLHNNLLNFHDTDRLFEVKGDLLKMITNKNYNVDLAILSDEKLMYDFAKEMYFDVRAPGNM